MKERILNSKFSLLNYSITLRDVVEHPLFSGSTIMIVGSNITNLVAYIFHVVIGRLLGPAAYGILVATLSLIGLITVSLQFLGMVVVKFVSAEEGDKNSLFPWFYKNALRLGCLIFVLTLIASPFISNFLSINISILLLLPPMFFLSALLLFYRSYLQGMLKFKEYVFSANFEITLRLLLGVVLILLGFSVFGAVAGIVLASLITLIYLKIVFRKFSIPLRVAVPPHTRKILAYTVPVFVATLANFSLITSDVILVKHFFDAHNAGIYGALSNLGKIIFYGTAPVSAVMFPIISKKHAKGEGYYKILIISLMVTFALAAFATLVYYFFPELMVLILYGKDFLSAAPYLATYGVFMTIYTCGALLIGFYLSREKVQIAYFSTLASLFQIFGIWFFHDTIVSVIHVSIVVSFGLLVALLLYFYYEIRHAKTK